MLTNSEEKQKDIPSSGSEENKTNSLMKMDRNEDEGRMGARQQSDSSKLLRNRSKNSIPFPSETKYKECLEFANKK